jgi:dienelactone hydrolase
MRKPLVILFLIILATMPATAEPSSQADKPLKPLPKLAPLLNPSSLPNTKRAWQEKRKALRSEWLKIIGGLPPSKLPLKTRKIGIETLPEFTREHMEYQVERGIYIDGYLLTPNGLRGKLPALVVFHATTPFGARGAAGIEPAYPEEKRHGVQWVRQGYIVWCPRNYINTPGADYAGNAAKLLARHPQWTGMGRMTWDAIRAADFLESIPRVDKKRIGCFGHSLGAKEVLYAMAFDERYRAGVFSEGGIGLRFSNWDAAWYLGKRIPKNGSGREHHELLALIAPRPLLLLAGDSADDQRSELFVAAAREAYDMYDAGADLKFFDHHKGHLYDSEQRAMAETFLNHYLRSGNQ